MVWTIFESKQAKKVIEKLPPQVLRKYQFWLGMMQTQGPEAIMIFPGFKDEALKGEWKGHRSSRLNIQYRVLYRIEEREVAVYVERVDPHTYR